MTDLTGRVAIVTGAAQGIGFGIAERLGRDGAALVLVDIDGEGLNDAAAGLADSGGGKPLTIAADLTDPSAAPEVTARAVEHFGGLDILVNNAGIRVVSSFVEHSLADWQRTLDVNLTAPFMLAQAAIPHMLSRGKGKIVNITSIAAELGFKNRAAYNVSKAGLAMLTKSIVLELGGQGIRCNSVAPGVIETPLNRHYFTDPGLNQIIVDATPAGTRGSPPDIAAAVAFLASDESDFVNGATVLVDGGWSTGKGY
jgi:NAD(P)-dependent dehydrogenase (short-subunit alcohol dehydrogenase family)